MGKGKDENKIKTYTRNMQQFPFIRPLHFEIDLECIYILQYLLLNLVQPLVGLTKSKKDSLIQEKAWDPYKKPIHRLNSIITQEDICIIKRDLRDERG